MFTLNCKGRLLVLDKPIVMGIINVTPDSFFSASRKVVTDELLSQAQAMIWEGATILDIGGQSTRPGSAPVELAEELQRVIPAIQILKQHFPTAIISVDTYQSMVAKQAIENGASIVNDISGGSFDKEMLSTVGKLAVPYVCMHMKGTPQTMQQHAAYEDVTREVLDYFIKKLEDCRLAGINDLIIDPGFGFAKTIEQNFQLLNKLEVFRMLERPVMAGISRKSTIYKTLGITADEALNGTTVLNTAALLKGASILRVHDVKEAVEAIKLCSALTHSTYEPLK